MIYSESLKKNKDFQLVYKNGISKANKVFVMYVMKNQSERNRIGISVSKKVGNSVVRHHLTRLVRESYRLNETSFKRGYDFIIMLRQGTADKTYHEIENSLLHISRIHGLLVEENI